MTTPATLQSQFNLLTKHEVLGALSISARTLETWVRDGSFPPPRRIGRTCYWTRQSMEAWVRTAFDVQNNWRPD